MRQEIRESKSTNLIGFAISNQIRKFGLLLGSHARNYVAPEERAKAMRSRARNRRVLVAHVRAGLYDGISRQLSHDRGRLRARRDSRVDHGTRPATRVPSRICHGLRNAYSMAMRCF